MSSFARTDTSVVGRWWWTVDHWLLASIALLAGLGILLSLAASPAVAERRDFETYYFVYRHLAYLGTALAVLFGVSLLSPRQIRRLAAAVFVSGLVLMALTLVVGREINGAQRWLALGPLSLQPSEFVKPAFVVVVAWILAAQRAGEAVPGTAIACLLLALVLGLLVLQPDMGQAALIAAVWGCLFFVAGLSMLWVLALGAATAAGAMLAYLYVPHVTSRIDRFLHPTSGDTYQVDTALDAFAAGGWFGSGPGDGVVKRVLPDAHTDYIFAVVGEEFGALLGLAIIALFGAVVLRGLLRALAESDDFVRLALAGLVILFGLQAVVNIGVNLNLLPSKGMTLPFISYGGSSLVALGLTMGMVLALSRRRPGALLPEKWS